MEKKRSLGVTVLSIIIILLGLLFLLAGVALSILLKQNINVNLPNPVAPMSIAALYFIGSGAGLFILAKWARMLVLVTSVFWVVLGAVGVFMGLWQGAVLHFLPLISFGIFFLLCFIFLMLPKVKEQFN